MTRHFMMLVKGAPPSIWMQLLTLGDQIPEKLMVYRPRLSSVEPIGQLVPWPLAWLLVFHSRKYRFLTSKRPDVPKVHKDLLQSFNKLMWRQQMQRSTEPLPILRRMQHQLPACAPQFGSLTHRWSSHFARVFSSVLRCTPFTPKPNVTGLHRLAFRLLRNLPCVLIPMDKSPGFFLVHKDEVNYIDDSALNPMYYQRASTMQISSAYQRPAALGLAKAIAKHHDDSRLASIIMDQFDKGKESTRLGLTAKTHKCQGEVTLRCIHKSSVPKLGQFSAWIVLVLRPLLGNISWLAPDSRKVVAMLHDHPITQDSVAYKWDIKDFYLSGTPLQIVSNICTYVASFDAGLADLVRMVLFYVLDTQFIIAFASTDIYKCIFGSGIGLSHSSVVANLLFFILHEQHVIPLFPCMKWIRYEDDALAILPSKHEALSIFGLLRSKSNIFRCKCEQVSFVGDSFEYLDLNIHVTVPRLTIMPAQSKPLTPLCVSSAHPMSTHLAWPGAVCSRVLAVCSKPSHRPQVLQLLLDRYTSVLAHPVTLGVIGSHMDRQHVDPSKSRRVGPSGDLARLVCVLRFHPNILFSFRRALALVPPPDELSLNIMPGWKNSLPSVSRKIDDHNLTQVRVGGCSCN